MITKNIQYTENSLIGTGLPEPTLDNTNIGVGHSDSNANEDIVCDSLSPVGVNNTTPEKTEQNSNSVSISEQQHYSVSGSE